MESTGILVLTSRPADKVHAVHDVHTCVLPTVALSEHFGFRNAIDRSGLSELRVLVSETVKRSLLEIIGCKEYGLEDLLKPSV